MFDEDYDIEISMGTVIGHKLGVSDVSEDGCYFSVFHKGENAKREFYLSIKDLRALIEMLEKTEHSIPEIFNP